MNKKIGPLPLWVWVGTAVAVAAVVYLRARASGGTTTPADPTAVDGQLPDLQGAMPGGGDGSGSGELTPTVPSEGPPAGTPTDPGGTGDFPDLPDPFAPDPPLLADPALPTIIGKLPPAITKRIPRRKATAPKHRKAHRTPARKAKTTVPGVKRGHRAPAHPHEHVHAPAPSHLREAPAHTRFNAPARSRPSHPQPAAPHAPGAAPKPAGRPVQGSPGKVRTPAHPQAAPAPVHHAAPAPPPKPKTVTPKKRKR